MFFLLLVGHAVADFPLQAGPMAAEKCRRSPTYLQRDVPWYYWLTAHAVIHGGAVYIVTGSLFLALLETAVHWFIDLAKCEGYTNIHVDQLLHVMCKVVWCLLWANGIPQQLDPSLVKWLA